MSVCLSQWLRRPSGLALGLLSAGDLAEAESLSSRKVTLSNFVNRLNYQRMFVSNPLCLISAFLFLFSSNIYIYIMK